MRKKVITSMCLLLTTLLCACGKETTVTETETLPSTEQLQLETETTEQQETVGEDLIPEEYALAVIVTINPQVKLYLDAESKIVGVEYLNEDAKTAFAGIDFSGITVEEGMEKIIDAAVEKEFLTDGKEVSIDVAEVVDESCAYTAVCDEMEAVTSQAVSENNVEAEVSAQVSAQVESTESTEEVVVENPCSNCGGTGKCDECLGDGYRGVGYQVSCPRCHGSFTETCIYCDASGNSNKHAGTCDFPNCMGAHVYACTTCNGGSTPVTCASCNGSGKCKVCGGTGSVE